uniref:Uncharacterized protein n=1 Tax=Anguilla anguilla TaxID=7936 RepID=A0A0E9WD83_ANGAN
MIFSDSGNKNQMFHFSCFLFFYLGFYIPVVDALNFILFLKVFLCVVFGVQGKAGSFIVLPIGEQRHSLSSYWRA